MSARRPLVAFYAPMKGPDHPVPSGDRTVARLYRKALQGAGFDVEVVSNFRSYDGVGDAVRQAEILAGAEQERHRLAVAWRAGRVPDLWFTYHLYHKAPDLLGPELAASFGRPYAVAEPSHAPKRAVGPWADFLARSEAAIRYADAVFVSTAADAECVAPLRAGRAMHRLSPFLDPEGWSGLRSREAAGPTHLITVAMMRAGDKLQSFALLAEALALVREQDFTLTIVGDGPARGEVEALFAPLAGRVLFTGAVHDQAVLSQRVADADLFVWPAVNEAYGMALLEAQWHGVPVVAGDEGGVREVVRHGVTGWLTPPRDAAAFADAVCRMIAQPDLRRRMGQAGRDFVLGERLLAHASDGLKTALTPLLPKGDR